MTEHPTLFSVRLERALRRASEWHDGQTRKGSAIPYVQHVFGVALILDRLGFSEDVVIAGLLHDAVEDSGVDPRQVDDEFGPNVARMVVDCSEIKSDPNGAKRPWIERKTEHLERLSASGIPSRAVALADKLHNLSSMLLDLEQGRDVWSCFNAGRDQVVWYYQQAIRRYAGDDPALARLAEECTRVLKMIASRGSGNPSAKSADRGS